VILVSDFYEPADEVVEAVRLLRGRGHDVLAFHVLDPAELDLPEGASTTYRDMESGEVIPVIPGRLREGYRAQVESHVATLRERVTAERVDYLLLDTSEPLDHALFRYLTIRERKSRKR